VPSKITIFAGPLLRASRDRADLEARVRETVLHEIAHHFGISDARLRELRASELGR
jgi:predicted Zn-dependent protease with MMP-like domain